MLLRLAKFLAHAVTTVLTLVTVLFAFLVVLLARGPISLAVFSPYIAASLNDADSPIHIAFDNTVLLWDGAHGRLDIRVIDVRINGPDGARLATVPQVAVRLRAAALLELRLEPERLLLLEPRLRLVRNAEGRFELGLGGAEGEQDLLASWLSGDWPEFTSTLEQVRVQAAELIVDDRMTGHLWRAPSADLALVRGPAGSMLAADAKMMIADRPARVAVNALFLGSERPLSVDIDFANVEPAILAEEAGLDILEPLAGVRMGVSGKLALTLTGETVLSGLDFELSAGAGVLALPQFYETPLPVTGMTAQGRLTRGPDTLSIASAVLDLGDDRVVHFQGEFVDAEDGLAVRGNGSIDNADADDLKSLWPDGFKPNTRHWAREHLEAGRLGKVAFELDIRPGELDKPATRPEMAVLTFEYSDVDCRYWKPMPALTRARGRGRIDAKRLEITVEAGRLDEVAISEGKIRIAHDVPDPKLGEIDFLAEGSAPEILAVLDRKPLELARNIGVDTTTAAGQGAVRVHLTVPLLKHVPLRDVAYSASARLSRFELANAFGAFALSDGALELAVSRDGLEAKGTVALNRVPMSISWKHDFGPEVKHPNRYGMAANLGDAERQALGIRLDPYLRGVSAVELQIAKDRAGRFEVHGVAELAKARLAMPQLKWQKPPGPPARAEFQFIARAGEPLQVSHFRIDSPGFRAEGRASLSAAGDRVVLDRVRLADHDFGADVTLKDGNASKVVLTGRTLDLRGLLDDDRPRIDGQPAAPAPAATALNLSATLERVIVTDAFWLEGVQASAARQGARWTGIDATGALNGATPVVVAMKPDGEGRQVLTVNGADAGGIFQATGFATGIAGGSLQLTVQIPEDGAGDGEGEAPTTGTLVAEDFRLKDAPVLTKVLTLGSLTGIHDLVQGGGIQFRRLKAEFVKRDELIRITSMRAAGPALGITMAGTIDRAHRRVELTGAIVPAYTINSALGGVPLVGRLLVGRKGEGVFAIDYRISGSFDDPVVTVNPLSVLAPGVLRRLVEVFGGPITIEPADAGQDSLVPDTARP